MLKLVKASLLALAGLGMASALAQSLPADSPLSGWRYVNDGSTTRIVFGSGGKSLPSNFAPVGSPSVVGNFGVSASNGDVYLRSHGVLPVQYAGKTGTLPIDAKLKMTRNVLAKSLAKSTLFYTAWETGSALYDIWSDFGLDFENGTIVNPSAGISSVSQGVMYRVSNQYHQSGYYSIPADACKAVVGQKYDDAHTITQYVSVANASSGDYMCSFNGVVTTTGRPVSGLASRAYDYPCASGYYVTTSGCSANPPPSPQLTQQEIEEAVADLLASEGWPTADARAAADALRIPQVQAEVLPLIEAQPETDTQVQVQGIPQGIPFEVGDPVTTTTTQTNPDGTTSEKVQTTTTTATATGNTIQTQRQTQTTTTTRDATGVVTGTTTATTTTAQTATTPATENEDLECGLPGGPACKIDEEGTPEPVDNDAQEGIDDLFRPLTECMNDPMSCLPELPDINWSFTFPSTCGSINLAAFAPFITSIDICQYQGMFHDIMSMLWAAAGVFGAIAIVGGASRQE